MSRSRDNPKMATIKNADMSEEMQQDAVACAMEAIERFTVERVQSISLGGLLVIFLQDVAAHIKKEFDKKYNPTWHCIVGRNFGSFVTHETRCGHFSWAVCL